MGTKGTQSKYKRGVRQGCPLFMILYTIAQEPLYQAIKNTHQKRSLDIPCQKTKVIGYADDSTFVVKSELDIIYIFTILKHFELASAVKLNTKNTKIFGFGEWQGRVTTNFCIRF